MGPLSLADLGEGGAGALLIFHSRKPRERDVKLCMCLHLGFHKSVSIICWNWVFQATLGIF